MIPKAWAIGIAGRVEKLEKRVSDLAQENAELRAKLAELEAKRGPGRPRKVEEAAE